MDTNAHYDTGKPILTFQMNAALTLLNYEANHSFLPKFLNDTDM
jgi:hypothetical protein